MKLPLTWFTLLPNTHTHFHLLFFACVWSRRCSSGCRLVWTAPAPEHHVLLRGRSGAFNLTRPCSAWFIYSKIHVVGTSSVSLEITWRGPETETVRHSSSYSFSFTGREREAQTKRDRKKEKRRGGVRGGWGASKKVWTPAPLWPVKITLWAFRVSEDEGGRGIRSFSARQGTAHAWLTLWIPAEPIYMLFLLPLYLILKVCQSQSLCLFQISLTSECVCVCACTRACVLGRGTSRRFSHAPTVQRSTQTTRQSLSGKRSISVQCVLRCSSSRGLIMFGLKAQTPPCQRQTL